MVGVVVVVAVCVVVVLLFHVSIFNVPLFSILWSFSNRQLHKMPVKNGSRSCNSCIKRHIGMYAQQSTIQFAHCTHSSPTTHTRYVFEKFPRQEYRILSIIHNVWNSVYRNVIKKRANKNNENIIDGSTKDNNEEKRSSSNSNSGRRKKKQQQQLKTTKSTMLKWWWWRRQKALSLLVHISQTCQSASQPARPLVSIGWSVVDVACSALIFAWFCLFSLQMLLFNRPKWKQSKYVHEWNEMKWFSTVKLCTQ